MLLTDMDLLTRLILPLAGPTPDSFDETEMETLPIDLQVLLCYLKIYGSVFSLLDYTLSIPNNSGDCSILTGLVLYCPVFI